MHLTAAQFSALFEGLDWKRVHAPSETPHAGKGGISWQTTEHQFGRYGGRISLE